MKSAHCDLWRALHAYVAVACDGREPSHGLDHMRYVTEHAVALFTMTAARSLCDQIANAYENEDVVDATAAAIAVVAPLFGSHEPVITKDTLLAFSNKYMGADASDGDANGTGLFDVAAATTVAFEAMTDFTASPLAIWVSLVRLYDYARRVPQMGFYTNKSDDACTSSSSKGTHTASAAPLSDAFDPDAIFTKAFALVSADGTAEAAIAAHDTSLARVLAIGMLHDVNDHKYEKPDGSLSAGLKAFVESTLCADGADGGFGQLLFPPTATNAGDESNGELTTIDARADTIMRAISAVSFSKEKKGGMRYFVEALGPQWTAVRDWVSDADKLEAIGERGLYRCWHYNLEVFEHKAGGKEAYAALLADAEKKEGLRKNNFANVSQHVDEKLGILKDVFIVGAAGKRLAATAHDEMMALLAEWGVSGPPRL